jgi:methyl-accepting chemotaxis protein
VRSLAQRSARAAKDIKELIGRSNAEVKDGVNLVNSTGTALSDIVNAIKKLTGHDAAAPVHAVKGRGSERPGQPLRNVA